MKRTSESSRSLAPYCSLITGMLSTLNASFFESLFFVLLLFRFIVQIYFSWTFLSQFRGFSFCCIVCFFSCLKTGSLVWLGSRWSAFQAILRPSCFDDPRSAAFLSLREHVVGSPMFDSWRLKGFWAFGISVFSIMRFPKSQELHLIHSSDPLLSLKGIPAISAKLSAGWQRSTNLGWWSQGQTSWFLAFPMMCASQHELQPRLFGVSGWYMAMVWPFLTSLWQIVVCP